MADSTDSLHHMRQALERAVTDLGYAYGCSENGSVLEQRLWECKKLAMTCLDAVRERLGEIQ